MGEGSWRKKPVTSAASPHCTQPQSSLVFKPDFMGISPLGTETLGWGAWCGAESLTSQGALLQSRYRSCFQTATHVWDQPVQISTPATNPHVASGIAISNNRVSVQLVLGSSQ